MGGDYDDRPTRQEILERFDWQPGEKEQLEREMADRQRRIDAETRAAEASRQRETGQQRPPAAKPTYGEREAAAKFWKGHIRTEIQRNTAFVFDTIAKETAKAIVAEERARKYAVEDMKSHYTDICNRFGDHPTHDAVKALRTRIDELQERIDRLEAAPASRPLKAVG